MRDIEEVSCPPVRIREWRGLAGENHPGSRRTAPFAALALSARRPQEAVFVGSAIDGAIDCAIDGAIDGVARTKSL